LLKHKMFLNLRRFSIAALVIAMLVPALGITHAEAARHHKKHVVHHVEDRFAEIVLEANTGYVLSEKNADKQRYPASMTKMMTLYLLFDALEDGTLSKNQRMPVSRHAAAQEPSSIGVQPGDTLRVEDAILSICTKSANDSAVVVAEALGGSEEHFGKMMTAKARQLGMNNTHFLDASGLFKPGHYSTARDMAILSRALILNHPRYYHYFSTQTFTYNGQTMANHNHLMSSYRGMDGIKTGYVYASGYNLAASAVHNGTRLIGVIMGGRTAKSRNDAMAQLLDQSFARIGNMHNISSLSGEHIQDRPAIAPTQRPAIETPDETVAENAPDNRPQFNSMGLNVNHGGEGEDDEDRNRPVVIHPSMTAGNTSPALQPQPLNTAALTPASGGPGSWAIQIGAFASLDSGEQALQSAKTTLQGLVSGTDSIAPLKTPQGMIYRARLSGLSRNGAQEACGILRGNCLVLSVE
jgi:D-alanyl-D-alanine carboxypeptidase